MTEKTERDRTGVGEDEAARPGRGEVTVQETSGEGAAEPDVSTEVHELREELDALNDRHLRLAADFDNYRKRTERDRHALAARLQADLVASMLDVLDDLQRVEESGEEGTKESLLEGFRLVERKLVTVLESAGVESVEAEGKRFDPEWMEAIMTLPTDDPEKDGHVADVFQRGYRFRDMLVRPARVRVHQYEEPGVEDE